MHLIITPDDRDAVFAAVQRLVRERHPHINPAASCLYSSVYGLLVLRAQRFDVVLQAGTCMWPRVRPDQDDGMMATHFSYVWEGDTHPQRVREALAGGQLPELHVWLAARAPLTLIDFTTGGLVEQARHVCRYDWPGDPPPPYLWVRGDALPDGVVYRPSASAIGFALQCVAHEFGEEIGLTVQRGLIKRDGEGRGHAKHRAS